MKTKANLLRSLLPCCLLAGGLGLAGCSTDNDIDLGEIDKTIGIGTQGFEIPVGSTNMIPLVDLLKIDDSDCIDTLSNGDYRFYKKDTGINPTNVKVNPVSVDITDDGTNVKNLDFIIPYEAFLPAATARPLKRAEMTKLTKTITAFNFDQKDLTGDIVKLTEATTELVPFKLTISFSDDLKGLLEKFQVLQLDLPKYLEFDKDQLEYTNGSLTQKIISVAGGKLEIPNITTNTDLILKGNVKGMNFATADETKTEGEETFYRNLKYIRTEVGDGYTGAVDMDGFIDIVINFNTEGDNIKVNLSDPAILADLPNKSFVIHSWFEFGDIQSKEIVLKEVKGQFDPDIDLKIDPVQITNIPDFLTKDGVTLDFDDLWLELSVESQLPISGVITNAKLTPILKGVKQTPFEVKNVSIGKEQTTKVLISRKDNRTKQPGYNDYHWSGDGKGTGDVGLLLTNIPDQIEFELEAKAKAGETITVELGKEYVLQPKYEISAPLALRTGSQIVYENDVTGWNKDLNDNDIDLNGNTYVMIEGQLTNNTPLELVVDSPAPIGVDGNKINDVRADIYDKAGNQVPQLNIKAGEAYPLKIKVTTSDNGMKTLDGIRYHVLAKPGTAQPLNSGNQAGSAGKRHQLQLKDLKVTLNGKVSLNPDKDK